MRVATGRVMAGAAVALAGYGAITLVAIGRWDHFPLGVAMFVVATLGFGALAWLAIPRQPVNRAVWVPAWAALFLGLGTAGWATAVVIGDLHGLDMSAAAWNDLTPAELPLAAVLSWEVVNLGAVGGMFLMLTLWLLLFPNGEMPSPRWRWVGWGTVAIMAALLAVLVWVARPSSTLPFAAEPDEYGGFVGFAGGALYGLLIVLAAACAVSLFLRHRRSTGEARQQYRWVGLGTAALFFAMLIAGQSPWKLLAATAGVTVGVACYAVAVTRYRLYDIDVVISRTLVYGTLAGFIGAVYVVVVVLVGEAVGAGAGNLGLAIAATALVAILFEPLRRRVQRWANRLVYGPRATPYEVLADLTRRLAGAEPTQGVLSRMARLMAESTGAEQAAVWLADGGRLRAGAGFPQMPTSAEVASVEDLDAVVYPVTHDGKLVGALQVTRSREDPLTPTERGLLANLAGSAGLILGNQRLNEALEARAAELRASRRRLVEAQDTERRRLERDLHDGAQQQVVALKVQINLAEHLARRNGADGLGATLAELAAEAQAALEDIRALARGVYPPLLESEGLAAAIRSQAAATPIPVEVTTDGIGRYPKDLESAVYFAAVEAMANAVKHARPTRLHVDLSATDRALMLEITDDGTGFDPITTPFGAGLINVRDRIEALGGILRVASAPGAGTALTASIPLEEGVPALSAATETEVLAGLG